MVYSNYASYGLALTEMGVISAATWGFGFVQYCLEKENIFYDEFCMNETLNQTKEITFKLRVVCITYTV